MGLLRFLGWTLLLAFVAFGAAIGWQHYKIRVVMEQLVAAASPYAAVSYSSVDSNFKGDIGVSGVRIKPNGSADVISVDSLMFHTPGLGFLLGLDDKNLMATMPSRMGVSVTGLTADIDNKWLKALEEDIEDNNPYLKELPDLGCGRTRRLTSTEYVLMGYQKWNVDFDATMEHAAEKAETSMSVTLHYRDMFNLDMNGTFVGGGFRSPPQVKNLRVLYKDRSMTRRLADYCAKYENVALEAHIAGRIAMLQAMVKPMHMELTPDITAAYAQFLRTPNEFLVTMDPLSPVDVRTFTAYKESDVPALLNMSAIAR